MNAISLSNLELMLRVVLSAFCAFFIGLEREKRLKNAGIRTHVIVAVSASLMMIVSKYGFYDVILIDGIDVDASRIAAGVVSAIGFLGAGVIYVRKENTIGLTTAAGLWATVGIGITLGAGLYFIGICTTVLMLLIQLIMHHMKFKPVVMISAQVHVNLRESKRSIEEIKNHFAKHDFMLRGGSIKRQDDGDIYFTCSLLFPKHMPIDQAVKIIEEVGGFKSIDISTL